ncbi:MAG: GNAT family N-acetyltransferase [Verrucomicrobiales bacterium]
MAGSISGIDARFGSRCPRCAEPRGVLAPVAFDHSSYLRGRFRFWDNRILQPDPFTRRRAGRSAVAEIAALYVSPPRWRQGAGRALCSAVFMAAVEGGFSAITLWVLTANSAAISFYEAQGFSCDGATRIEETSNGASRQEVRMRRRLPLKQSLRLIFIKPPACSIARDISTRSYVSAIQT